MGIDDILAEATPQEKVLALEDLQRTGITTMVGDGINDAPALAAADVGVAIGARGATASSEAADVVLVVDRLQRLVDAIRDSPAHTSNRGGERRHRHGSLARGHDRGRVWTAGSNRWSSRAGGH